MGELVRVLPGLYKSRPKDFGELALGRELYFVFYTLRYALRDKQTEVVSYQPVPEWARPYPLMRLSWGTDDGGKPQWKIADASVRWTIEQHQRIPPIVDLTPEQKKLSIHALWPHVVMVEMLSQGWTPEREERLLHQGAQDQAGSIAERSDNRAASFYLYFRKKANAEGVGQRLLNRGLGVEIRKGSDGKSWLVLAKKQVPGSASEMDGLRKQFETLAEEFDGEYDGWQVDVS